MLKWNWDQLLSVYQISGFRCWTRLLLSQTITEIIIVIPPVDISLLIVCKVIVLLYTKLYSKHFSVCKVLTLWKAIFWTLLIHFNFNNKLVVVVVVPSLSCVSLFGTPWTAAHQCSLSFIVSWSLLRLISIESMMPFNYNKLMRLMLLLSLLEIRKLRHREVAYLAQDLTLYK